MCLQLNAVQVPVKRCTNGDLVDIRINFMKEFYKLNKIIDTSPLNTNNTYHKTSKR